MTQVDREALKGFAKYVWWKTPDEAVAMPERLVAQVMNIGDYSDVQVVAIQVGDACLRDVLTHAEIGQFNERSWAYWHYRLGLATLGNVPPMPVRKLGELDRDPPKKLMKADVRLTDFGFIARMEDGRCFERSDLLDLAHELHAIGVTADDVVCGDWREGENILMSGQQIALKFELRRLWLRA